MQTGCDNAIYAIVPLVVFIAVLAFRTHIAQLVSYAVGIVKTVPSQAIVAPAPACRRRPNIPGKQLQQLGFAGTIGAHEYPALPRGDMPIDPAQHAAATELQSHVVQFNLDKASARALPSVHHDASRLSLIHI